jgi:hypothetical protein
VSAARDSVTLDFVCLVPDRIAFEFGLRLLFSPNEL